MSFHSHIPLCASSPSRASLMSRPQLFLSFSLPLLQSLAKVGVSLLEIKKILVEVDENRDGNISYDEFKSMMRKIHS